MRVIVVWLALFACSSGPAGPLAALEAHLDGTGPLPTFPVGEPLHPDVRERVVQRALGGEPGALQLMVSLANRAEPAYLRGANVVADRAVVDALIAIAPRQTADGTRARRVLATSVARDQLRSANTHPLTGLRPTDRTSRQVLAKAGLLPLAREDEQALLDALAGATRGAAQAAAIDELGHAATDRTLAAVAATLRTPLLRPWRGGVRSVRLDVMEALHPHWPAEMAFAANEVNSSGDYRRAESRVDALLGVVVTGDVPPFFTAGEPPASR